MSTANKKHEADEKYEELAASKESVMEAYDKLMEATSHFRKAADAAGIDLKDDAMAQLEKGREKAGEWSGEVDRYMKEKPLTTLGIAFAFGYVLANLLSRK